MLARTKLLIKKNNFVYLHVPAISWTIIKRI